MASSVYVGNDLPRAFRTPERARELGVGLIALTGLIHLIEAPEYWGEVHYIGALFGLTVVGAAIAAYGIARSERWGWLFGAMIAIANAGGYLLSRTVGLPHFREQSWSQFLEPMGMASLVVEALFVILAVRVLSRTSK